MQTITRLIEVVLSFRANGLIHGSALHERLRLEALYLIQQAVVVFVVVVVASPS